MCIVCTRWNHKAIGWTVNGERWMDWMCIEASIVQYAIEWFSLLEWVTETVSLFPGYSNRFMHTVMAKSEWADGLTGVASCYCCWYNEYIRNWLTLCTETIRGSTKMYITAWGIRFRLKYTYIYIQWIWQFKATHTRTCAQRKKWNVNENVMSFTFETK